MRTEYTIQLCNRFQAIIILKGEGQQPADTSDDVVVAIDCLLPREDGGRIPMDLCFYKRIPEIFNQYLSSVWGYITTIEGKDYSRRTWSVHAPTWKEACARAAEYAREQLAPLQEALKNREQALRDAGEWV